MRSAPDHKKFNLEKLPECMLKKNRLDLGSEFIVECWNGHYVVPKNDIYVGGSLITYGEFSRAEFETFQKLVTPGSSVVEIGANLGAHTVGLSKLTGPTGRVIAFEPQPQVYRYLVLNTLLNKCKNVEVFQFGLSDKADSMFVPDDTTERTNYGGISLGNEGEVEVKVLPGDTLLSGLRNISLIKIDVEGMEVPVLKGLKETIDGSKPALFVENDRVDNSKELIELLWSYGYKLFWDITPLYNPLNFNKVKENKYGNIHSFNMVGLSSNTDDFNSYLITDSSKHPLVR